MAPKTPQYGTQAEIDASLNQRDPFVQWQTVDVQFPATANTDYIIRHNLQVDNPKDIHYRVIKQFTGGSVYESVEPGTKPWTSSYIVLRSDFGGWTGRLMLGTLNKVPGFNTIGLDIPNTTEETAASIKLGIALTIDGAGSVITTGIKNSIRVPFGCTITSATLLSADDTPTSGSISIDIYKDAYSSYPSTTSITSATPPSIVAGIKATDSTLAGWTTAITEGDVLTFEVVSVTDLIRATLILGITEN